MDNHDTQALYNELRHAQEDLEKWRGSEHPSIIAECERRVKRAKVEIFKAEGTINLKE